MHKRISLAVSFLVALMASAESLACLRTIFVISPRLNAFFSLVATLVIFPAFLVIFYELIQKMVSHFFPWLTPHAEKQITRKILIPDVACLEDGRICDLVRTGIIDHQLIIPHFLVEKIKLMTEDEDEFIKERAKLALETIHRLETCGITPTSHYKPVIELSSSLHDQLLEVAKTHQGVILSNDSALKGTTKSEYAEVPVIFLEAVASSLKPALPKGQQFSIKIQRLGKEAKQGIGYLDDRTMVVVNGGGDFLGKQVKIQVLSQKYSSSGKIIFCNLLEPVLGGEMKAKIPVLANTHEEYVEE